MIKRFNKRAVFLRLLGCLSVAIAVMAVGGRSLAAVGATTPFTSYEAEAGTLAGGAAVVSLTSAPTTQYSSPQLEASGHAYVALTGTGQSVTWTNSTSSSISAINIRASIPDTSSGGGTTATLDLYVNGTLRQVVTLSSRQSWLYEGNNNYNGNDQNPADGDARDFFDETPVLISGAAVAPGSTISLRQDSTNTAAFYWIDVIDLEAPVALAQPANSLSITTYGAQANTSSFDSTSAIQNCINAAQSQAKSVWVPTGTYYLNTTTGITGTGITIQGAGVWYSTIYRNIPLPNSTPLAAILTLTSCTVQNLHLNANAISRASSDGDGGGIDMAGSNWLINNVWIQHTSSGCWAAGSGGTVQNSRITSSWGDGINLNNVSNNATTGTNLTAQNNFIRGTGDDALAINSVNYNNFGGTIYNYTQMQNITMSNNTTVAPWGGKGVGVYGGINDLVQNNLLMDSPRYRGLGVGTFGTNGASLQSAVIQGNTLLRCGGNGYLQQQAALAIGGGGDGPGLGLPNVANVHISGNTVTNSMFGAIDITALSNLVLQGNTVNSPGLYGIQVESSAVGDGVLYSNSVSGVSSGQSSYSNNSVNFDANNAPISAASFNGMSGAVQTETCSEGGQDIASVQNGFYTVYNNVDLNGVTNFIARVACAGSGGNIAIYLDSPTGTLIGTCPVMTTGGAQTWADAYCNLTGATGIHNVYLVYTGGTGNLFSVEWLSFITNINYTIAATYNSVAGGITVGQGSEGVSDLENIVNASYVSYNNINFTGLTHFLARVTSGTSGGNLQLRLDSATGTLIGTCVVPGTGGWSNWVDTTCSLSGATGTHNLYLVFTGGNGGLMNVEWFAFSAPGSVPAITSDPPIATGMAGATYSFTFAAIGTPAPTFVLASGSLPPGLTLSPTGVLTGTPTQAGTFSGTVTAGSDYGVSSAQSFTITIAPVAETTDTPTLPPWGLALLATLLTLSAAPLARRSSAGLT